MSSLRHVDISISGDDSRPVRVWEELVEAVIHTCTRHPGSLRIVRAIRCLRHVLVGRVVQENQSWKAIVETNASVPLIICFVTMLAQLAGVGQGKTMKRGTQMVI